MDTGIRKPGFSDFCEPRHNSSHDSVPTCVETRYLVPSKPVASESKLVVGVISSKSILTLVSIQISSAAQFSLDVLSKSIEYRVGETHAIVPELPPNLMVSGLSSSKESLTISSSIGKQSG